MAGSPQPVNVQQDLQLIPLLNLVAEPVSGSVAPSAGNVGKVYRNTTTGRIEWVLNATTVAVMVPSGAIANADIAAGAAIALSKLATDPLARANHTGTQVAATISDLAAVVQAYRLDQFAQPTADVPFNGRKITGAADGTLAQDYTTLQQVQNLLSATVNGQDWKNSARVAVTTNVNVASPGASLDGVAMAANDRVLLTGQTTASQNGLYVWNGAAAAMIRATDADASVKVTSGMTVPIETGSKADSYAILTTDGTITLGTTALTFTFLSGAATYTASGSIQVVGNNISIVAAGVSVGEGGTGATTAAAARTSLNIPQRGFAADLGAITAGVGLDVTHSLGTLDVTVQVYRKSDGATVNIGANRKDVNTVTITSDIAVTTGTLRVVVEPIA